MIKNPCDMSYQPKQKKIRDTNTPDSDLSLYYSGHQECDPGHLYNGVREHYLLHYITAGQGIVQLKDQSYQLKENYGFLCPANTKIYYQADLQNPWEYYWIGFHGLKAAEYLEKVGITPDNPIFYYDRNEQITNCLADIFKTDKNKPGIDFYLNSRLNELFYLLSQADLIDNNRETINQQEVKEGYVKKAIQFISFNFSHNISVEEIADYTGVSRKYLCSLFNEFLDKPTQQYLIEYRINKACELLTDSNLSITEVAFSVGYDNSLVFSKAFKKIKGIPPSTYRKKGIK